MPDLVATDFLMRLTCFCAKVIKTRLIRCQKILFPISGSSWEIMLCFWQTYHEWWISEYQSNYFLYFLFVSFHFHFELDASSPKVKTYLEVGVSFVLLVLIWYFFIIIFNYLLYCFDYWFNQFWPVTILCCPLML